jgi:hypothetical protein
MPQCQFLFSTTFVFQKSYTGNILRIGRNESQTSYFSRHEDGVQSRDGGGSRAGHTIGWRPPLWPCNPVVWAPGVPSDIALPPIYSLQRENPKGIGIHPWKVPQCRRHRRPISGDRSLYSGILLGWRISSIAISITVDDSHDEEGVVLPQGWGLYQ